jgi:hypothetical protein
MRTASDTTINVRTLSVRRNAQAINVLISSRKPSQYPEMTRQLRQVARKLKAQSKRHKVSTSMSNGYTCLEVGAREGRLLQCWPEEAPLPSEYIVLERNQKYNSHLRQSMREKHVTGSIIHSRRPPSEIESLQRRQTKFDLIVFSHCLYWMSSEAAKVVHETIQSLLHENGICLIFHHAFGFYSLWHLMERQFARNEPLQVQPHSSGSSAVQLVAALNQFQQEHQQNKGRRHDKLVSYSFNVAAMDPCPLYMNGLSDRQWNEVLSFIFQIEASELPLNIREEAIQLVLGSATQTSENTNKMRLTTSLHSSTSRNHARSVSIDSCASSIDSNTILTSSSHHSTIDGSIHTTKQTIHGSKHDYWLHHPHVTIKIQREEVIEE